MISAEQLYKAFKGSSEYQQISKEFRNTENDQELVMMNVFSAGVKAAQQTDEYTRRLKECEDCQQRKECGNEKFSALRCKWYTKNTEQKNTEKPIINSRTGMLEVRTNE